MFESNSKSMSEEKEKIRRSQMKFYKLYVNKRIYNKQLKVKKD